MTLDLIPFLPELLLIAAAVVLLMAGVFRKSEGAAGSTVFTVLVLIVAFAVVAGIGGGRQAIFGGMFLLDGFSVFSKELVLLATALTAAMSYPYLEREKIAKFEFPVLMLFATIGMLMMVSANDFLSLYLGLEMQSLSLYVLAAYHRDNLRSTEAALKYFVLGCLASGMLLYGISLIYGFAGTTSFDALSKLFGSEHLAHPRLGVIAGVVFILAGLAFKISAVPFHMWTPDVYEGAPTPVTAFYSIGPKIAAFSLLIRVLNGPFGDLAHQWQQVVVFISLASMGVGAFAAIQQTNIKRLMAYSSIGHVGFALVGLAAGKELGIQGVLVYLAIYLFMNVGTFAVILSMRQKGRMVENISDLAGLGKTNPAMAAVMAVLMFSMAGVPPMAGFWGKFYVFMAAVRADMWTLAILGVLSSVVSAFYYLRIVKVMYFDEPTEAFDRPADKPMRLVMVVATAVVLLFTFVPGPLLNSAKAAAQVLFPAAG